jgi:hypothetical protein
MYEADEAGSPKKTIGFAAAWATGLTLLCVMIGTSAQQYADSLDPAPTQVAAAKGKKPVFNAIDYATTGAITGQTVILSPCER